MASALDADTGGDADDDVVDIEATSVLVVVVAVTMVTGDEYCRDMEGVTHTVLAPL